MKVLIVGAGIGGLALAKFLREKNIDVTVIEQAPKWKTLGFVIGLWPCGYSILDKLGCAKELRKDSAEIQAPSIYDINFNKLTQMKLSNIKQKYGPTLEFERDILHRLLRKVNKKTKILLNTTLKSIKNNKDKAIVTFSNGKKEEFDLVVGADGIDSQMRKLIQKKKSKSYTGFRYWFVWIKKDLLKNYPGVCTQIGQGKTFVIFPSKNKEKIAVYFTMPRDKHKTRSLDENIKILKEEYKDFKGPVEIVLKNLPKKPSYVFDHDDNEVYLKKWYKNRIVLIGDAAHATSPALGLGASMALEDAYILSKKIVALKNPQKLQKALEKYNKERYKRISRLPNDSQFLHFILGINKPFRRIKKVLIKKHFGPYYLKWANKILKETPK